MRTSARQFWHMSEKGKETASASMGSRCRALRVPAQVSNPTLARLGYNKNRL